MWGLKYKVGDVIIAKYNDFDGNERKGIFLVIYNERQDRSYASNHSNLTCAKITTNGLVCDNYVVKLKQGDGNLEKDCMVNLSKIHTLSVDKVIGRFGSLNRNIMTRILKTYTRFNNEVMTQIMDLI